MFAPPPVENHARPGSSQEPFGSRPRSESRRKCRGEGKPYRLVEVEALQMNRIKTSACLGLRCVVRFQSKRKLNGSCGLVLRACPLNLFLPRGPMPTFIAFSSEHVSHLQTATQICQTNTTVSSRSMSQPCIRSVRLPVYTARES
jgi:hypothetical protein